MPLEQLIRLKAVQARLLGELGMCDESTSEGLDEEKLLGGLIQVGAAERSSQPRPERNFEVNVH